MASVNKCILVGNLGKDPEVRYTPGGQAVAKFPLATTDNWTDQSGQRQEKTEWHNVVVWGKQAENCGQYLAKGRQVYLEGSIRSRSYDDKEGNKRFVTEIVAQRVQFLGSGNGNGSGRGAQSDNSGLDGGFDDFGGGPIPDDVPF